MPTDRIHFETFAGDGDSRRLARPTESSEFAQERLSFLRVREWCGLDLIRGHHRPGNRSASSQFRDGRRRIGSNRRLKVWLRHARNAQRRLALAFGYSRIRCNRRSRDRDGTVPTCRSEIGALSARELLEKFAEAPLCTGLNSQSHHTQPIIPCLPGVTRKRRKTVGPV